MDFRRSRPLNSEPNSSPQTLRDESNYQRYRCYREFKMSKRLDQGRSDTLEALSINITRSVARDFFEA